MPDKIDKIVKLNKALKLPNKGLVELKNEIDITKYNVLVQDKKEGKTYLLDSSELNSGGGDSGLESIVAGDNITIDDTDPQNLIISATGGGSPALFPNGYVEVNESRDFNSGDANKLLGIKSDDITLSMPSVNPFGEGCLIGVQNTNDYKNTHIILKEGNEPLLIGDEVFIIDLIDIGGGIYIPQPLTGIIYDENEENEKSITRYLYDQSQNAIPLSGTEVGSPVTGDVDMSDLSMIKNVNQTRDNGINFEGDLTRIGFWNPDDYQYKSGGVLTTSSLSVAIAVRDFSLNEASIQCNSVYGIKVIDNIFNRGLTSNYDFTANIDSLDYTQKKYVGFRGTATLSSGTVTVATDKVLTGYKIYVSVNTPSGTQGFLSAPTGSIVDATEFVINSTSATDNSTVNWWIAP